MTFDKCSKKGHTRKECRSKGTGSSGNPPRKSKSELPEWVTKKTVVSDTKDPATATRIQKNNKYKWCTYWNNGNGAWGFHWKDGHEEWKNKQGKNLYFRFSNTSTNTIIYCYYLMTTSEESIEEEAKGGDDSQNDDFISLSCFELLKWLIKRAFSPLLLFSNYFMTSVLPWILIERERESSWIWSPRKSSRQCHNNPVFFPPRKPPDNVKDFYDGQTYDLKKRVDIWMRMDVVPVDYGTFAHKFLLGDVVL